MRINKNLVVSNISNRFLGQKNFVGEARRYNEAGKRNFLLYLDDPNAKYEYGGVVYYDPNNDADRYPDENGHTGFDKLRLALEADGWNVKDMPANEERGWDAHPYIKVMINLHRPNGRGPKVCMINQNNTAVTITEDGIDDFMNGVGRDRLIDFMNVAITPSNYDYKDGGNSQAAYASVMYFKFVENDAWADMYR